MDGMLQRHREIWKNKKILREIYLDWYKKIIADLSDVKGITLELGAGSGNFKEFMPEAVSADIENCHWLDMCFDAHDIPLDDGSVSNIVLVDVLHHLDNPVKFLSEAARILNTGGRLIMLEPFPSAFSLSIYKRFHPEPFIFDIDYFSKKETLVKDPWISNQAIPYLIFFKHRNKFLQSFGSVFRILKKEKLSFLLYPASGGFENTSRIPDRLIPFFKKIEKLFIPFSSLLAFRCYVVLEKS